MCKKPISLYNLHFRHLKAYSLSPFHQYKNSDYMLQGKWVRYILEKMESSPNFVLQCTAVYYEPFNTKKEINSFVALIWKIFIRFFFCFYLLINNLWILRTNHLTRCDKIIFYFLRIFSFSQAIFPLFNRQ